MRRGPQPVPAPTAAPAVAHELAAHILSLAGLRSCPVMSRLWSRHAPEVLNSHGAWIQRTWEGRSSSESHSPIETSSPWKEGAAGGSPDTKVATSRVTACPADPRGHGAYPDAPYRCATSGLSLVLPWVATGPLGTSEDTSVLPREGLAQGSECVMTRRGTH